MREKPAIARKISQLAEQEQGYVRRQQLLALGLSDDAIDHRITNGELIPTYAGVYAVGHREPGPIPVAAAVVLACGDDAVLSHDSAAALWGLGPWPKRHEVIAPYQRRRTGIVGRAGTGPGRPRRGIGTRWRRPGAGGAGSGPGPGPGGAGVGPDGPGTTE